MIIFHDKRFPMGGTCIFMTQHWLHIKPLVSFLFIGVEDAKGGLQRGQAFNISTVHHFVPPLIPVTSGTGGNTVSQPRFVVIDCVQIYAIGFVTYNITNCNVIYYC